MLRQFSATVPAHRNDYVPHETWEFVAHEMREFVFFFSAKKNQKARAPKNSLIQLRISLAFWYAHASMYFNILFLVFDYYQIES